MTEPMSYSDAANILEAHNQWRRGQNDDTDATPKWNPEDTQTLGAAIDVAVDGLRKLSEESKWISCSERLPGADMDVLVHDSDDGITVGGITPDGAWHHAGEWELYGVTHWMPLPSYPRK